MVLCEGKKMLDCRWLLRATRWAAETRMGTDVPWSDLLASLNPGICDLGEKQRKCHIHKIVGDVILNLIFQLLVKKKHIVLLDLHLNLLTIQRIALPLANDVFWTPGYASKYVSQPIFCPSADIICLQIWQWHLANHWCAPKEAWPASVAHYWGFHRFALYWYLYFSTS